MFLKLNTIPNSEKSKIKRWADTRKISPISATNRKVPCIQFPLEKLQSLLETVPEASRRPWMFDATDDVIECEASNRLSNGNVEIWWSFNDLEKNELKTQLTPEQMADLLDDCRFATLNYGQLTISECVGHDWSGEEDWVETAISVYDWVNSYGQNRKDITKLFAAYLLRFGGDWLKEISEPEATPEILWFFKGHTDATDLEDTLQTVSVFGTEYQDISGVTFINDLPNIAQCKTRSELVLEMECKGWELEHSHKIPVQYDGTSWFTTG